MSGAHTIKKQFVRVWCVSVKQKPQIPLMVCVMKQGNSYFLISCFSAGAQGITAIYSKFEIGCDGITLSTVLLFVATLSVYLSADTTGTLYWYDLKLIKLMVTFCGRYRGAVRILTVSSEIIILTAEF